MNKIFRLIARLLFGGLILFEMANQFNILHFDLDFTWLGLAITSVGIWLILEVGSFFLKKSCGQPINGLVMCSALVIVYFDAFGDIFHFYGKISWYDQVAHFLGGATLAGLIYYIIWNLLRCEKIRIGRWGAALFTIGIASFLGTVYEIEEYLEDLYTGSHRLGDGPDTANDLLMNNLGAISIIIIIILLISVYPRLRSALDQRSAPRN